MHSLGLLTRSAIYLFIVLVSIERVAAQSTPETVSRGKQATALVVAETRRVSGTAFCVDPAGYFVT
ncbi:MAG: hypothetical protein ACKPJD_29015, partial [Planctomycetaceae bacterium]